MADARGKWFAKCGRCGGTYDMSRGFTCDSMGHRALGDHGTYTGFEPAGLYAPPEPAPDTASIQNRQEAP